MFWGSNRFVMTLPWFCSKSVINFDSSGKELQIIGGDLTKKIKSDKMYSVQVTHKDKDYINLIDSKYI